MRLAEYLEATGVSPERLAKDAGLSGRTIRNLIEGRWISLRSAIAIRDATHGAVDLEDMVAPGGARVPAASADRGDESEGMA